MNTAEIRSILSVGHYGLGEQNEAGERLIDFCTTNQLSVMKTFFQNHKRKLYTWTSPNGIHKNMTIKPWSDCGTDHKLLMCKFKIKLWKKRRQQLVPKFDLTSKNRFSVPNTTVATTYCGNYWTIALISHASKVLLKIIQGRLLTYIER